jgi:DNA gyrase subunit A
MIVGADDEVLVVMERGKVVRSAVSGVPAKGRDTMGVVFAKPDPGDRIIAVARNPEGSLVDPDEPVDAEPDVQAVATDPTAEVAEGEGVGDAATDIDGDEQATGRFLGTNIADPDGSADSNPEVSDASEEDEPEN